jgi:hypothetical protein
MAATRKPQAKKRKPKHQASEQPPKRILAVDIGGTKIKVLATGQTEPRKTTTGKTFTPTRMVETVKLLAKGWGYDAVSIGYPGLVGNQGPRSEPGNLGSGWVGFDFAAAFGCPVRIMNDAAMQALGSYDGGRMLFLGFGTGLGSVFIADNVVVPMELGQLQHPSGGTLGEVVSRKGLARSGKDVWRDQVNEAVLALTKAFVADYVVLGGGNAKRIKVVPAGARLGNNLTAFRGGFRLWNLEDVTTLSPHAEAPAAPKPATEWRVI